MAIRGGLGRRQTIVVTKLVNAHEIRHRNSIPTTALAIARFEAAVTAATTEWIEAGPLSSTHMALLMRSRVDGLDSAISESLARYGFEDPFTGGGTVELEAISVSVGLTRQKSLAALFVQVERKLQAASVTLPDGWRFEDRTRQWCPIFERLP
jgi:hypothetical protein